MILLQFDFDKIKPNQKLTQQIIPKTISQKQTSANNRYKINIKINGKKERTVTVAFQEFRNFVAYLEHRHIQHKIFMN